MKTIRKNSYVIAALGIAITVSSLGVLDSFPCGSNRDGPMGMAMPFPFFTGISFCMFLRY